LCPKHGRRHASAGHRRYDIVHALCTWGVTEIVVVFHKICYLSLIPVPVSGTHPDIKKMPS
jgi:hypothetical protein